MRSTHDPQHIIQQRGGGDFRASARALDQQRLALITVTVDGYAVVGARALRQNMTSPGPLVLPLSEQLLFGANFLVRRACKHSKALTQALPVSWTKPYTPDFKKAFDFYCIHTGGRGIIDGLEKEMSLSRRQVEPSRASLYHFGNTSSTR